MLTSKLQTKWNLAKHYYTSSEDQNLQTDLQKVDQIIAKIAKKYKGQISQLDSKNWLEFFALESELDFWIEKPYLYYSYQNSLDTQNQTWLKAMSEIQQKLIYWSDQILFIQQEMKDLGQEKLKTLASDPKLKNYKSVFEKQILRNKYLLPLNVEKSLNLKLTGLEMTLKNLFQELTGSFLFEMGDKKDLTEEEIRSYRYDPDPKKRQAATESLRHKFLDKTQQIVFGNLYSGVVKNWTSEVELRKYDSVMEKRNMSEEMDNEVVDKMLNQVQKQYPLYQRFLELKAKILQQNKLNPWDIFAPVGQTSSAEISFEKAFEIVETNVRKFDPNFADFINQMFKNGQVDVFPQKGKRGGAFASYTKNQHSMVLLNFTGKLNDVLTLAHELGHAYHGFLSQVQPSQSYSSSLCLAETASIFTETLVFAELLKLAQDPAEKLFLLDKKLQDIFATIFAQVRYTIFEKAVHQEFLKGGQLSYLDLNQLWHEKLLEQVGDKIEFNHTPQENSGWSAVPHFFYTPFYCYAYSFGNLLSFSLYQDYQNNSVEFLPKFHHILKSGSSQRPRELLLDNGFDVFADEFYLNGFKTVEGFLNDLVKLV